MLRAIFSALALVAISAPITACDTSQAPFTDTSVAAAQSGQARIFFPPTVDTYRLNAAPRDRDHLAELHALRQIDPCGFVNRQTLSASGHPDFSYTYTVVPSIESGGNSPIAPLGGEGCAIAFPSAKTGLTLQVLPGEPRWNDAQFSPDPDHPGVTRQTGAACTFRINVPLTNLSGAPASMHDPALQVTPVPEASDITAPEDSSVCQVVRAIAGDIVGQVGHRGMPVHATQSVPGARFLTGDPCSAAADLPAAGFVWEEPNSTAQWPTTWRHPMVCNLQLDQTLSGSATAVVKYGLVDWSADMLAMPWGEDPRRDEREGVELFSYDSYLAPGCLVIAKSNVNIEPVAIGTRTTNLVSSTPIVTVRLNGPIGGVSCSDIAKRAALNAINRAT